MADFTVRNANDEIEQFQVGRYISSNEALWRIFSFPIHERYPTVVHLSVHLENGQRVFYTGETMHAVAAEPPKTSLTAFFNLCSHDDFARSLLYSEVPTYYRVGQDICTLFNRLPKLEEASYRGPVCAKIRARECHFR